MRILLVYKDSNFDLHGPRVASQVEQGRVESWVLSELQRSHDDHHRTIESVRNSLAAEGLTWAEVNRGQEWPEDSYDVVITIGGDGTVLYSSHFIAGSCKIVGVRSSDASVGYLCAHNPGSASKLGRIISAGELVAEPVERLQAEIAFAGDSGSVTTQPVLNDLLFVNSNPTLTTRYILRCGQREQFQRSSGIWISTPVGSTAGIRAGGGQRQDYHARNFQFRIRELFKGGGEEEFIEAGLFSPEESAFLIDNRSELALLALDGQHQSFNLEYGDQFSVKRAIPLNLVISPKLKKGEEGFLDIRKK